MVKPRLLLRIGSRFKRPARIDVAAEVVQRKLSSRPHSVDTDWRDMLARLDREDNERRLAEMERALNGSVKR